MRIVIALGGNALLRRGDSLTAENQRHNVRRAAEALAPLAHGHELIVTHGNGPQVGLLALQSAAYDPRTVYPLDVLDAESEGMIGYLIEQELANRLPDRHFATLLTQVEVDPDDPAFGRPTKPIGPVYGEADVERLAAARRWSVAPDGAGFRRVVASPRPKRVLELGVIEMLLRQGVIVICAGGGGIPVVRRADDSLVGVEAVIDKDFASSLLARELKADAFFMLTDIDGVYLDWGKPGARCLRRVAPAKLRQFSFAPGSMGPKVDAACEFVEATGGIAAIGRLQDATALLAGNAGSLITLAAQEMSLW
jgi:carbamate kinase